MKEMPKSYDHQGVEDRLYEKWEKNNWKNSKKQTVKNKDYWQFLIPWFRNDRIKFKEILSKCIKVKEVQNG